MAPYLLGSCICEKVKYEVKDDFISFKLCHCRLCQKASGSSNVANAFTFIENINWQQGENHLESFDVPNSQVRRVFCKTCGTSMPFLTQNERLLVVPVGTLSVQPKLPPQEVRVWHERMSWYDESKRLESLLLS
ncbi:hypothetical protein OA92_12995 [Marinomonas sp. SBI22]|nr:hypothetical protein OA92_12995 [Marinomonas sp. SBI22]KZM47321.1 hypothetical protein OA91_00410 [Marinomonas sp. SBI8L]